MTEPPPEPELEQSYRNLLTLWTSGVRDYHSLLSDYLTANSIFVAAVGFLSARQPQMAIFSLLVLVLSVFGIFITLQMAIVLGRFDAQNALWEWRLRGIERAAGWKQLQPFDDYFRLKDQKQILEDDRNIPPQFHPNWALSVHRQWWARRAVSFPLFFAIIYLLFLAWSLMQLFA
jgi:hypothetical protein